MHPFLLPIITLLVAAGLSAGLSVAAWWRHRGTGRIPFSLLSLAVAVWAAGYALELLTPDLGDKMLWARVQYIGIVAAPVLWLGFILQYTGRGHWLSWRTICLLSVVPLTTLTLVWSNDLHHLIWTTSTLEAIGAAWVLHVEHGWWFWLHTAYSYLAFASGTVFLLSTLIRTPSLYRKQALALLVAGLAPFVGNVIYLSGLNPFPGVDPTPFFFTVTALASGWALIGFRLLDIMPAARNEVIENMVDALLVLDHAGRIVYLNPAAELLVAGGQPDVIGQPIQAVVPPTLYLAIQGSLSSSSRTEIALQQGEASRHFDISMSPLINWRGTVTGQVIVVRDITERREAEEELKASQAQLQGILDTASSAIISIDQHQRIVLFNRMAERMFGYRADEIMGQPLAILLPERLRGAHHDHVRQFALEGASQQPMGERGTLIVGHRKNGEDFPVEVSISALRVGSKLIFTAIVNDITLRKRTELWDEDRNRVLEMVARSEPLEKTLTQIALMIERRYPGALCGIMRLENGHLFHRAAPNLPKGFVRKLDGLAVSPGASRVEAEALWERLHDTALEYGLRGAWSIPLKASTEKLIGALGLYYHEPRSPSPEEHALVGSTAQLAVVAIEHQQLTEELAHQAWHDPLTGLPNRRLFNEYLRQAIDRAAASGAQVAVLYVDLDRYKQVNDALGHAAGDKLLQLIARRLKRHIRSGDTIARMGGDEFAAVLCDIVDPQQAVAVVEKLLGALHRPFSIKGQEVIVTTSIGIGLYPSDASTAEDLIRKADNALYRAKDHGRNTYRVYASEMSSPTLAHLTLESQLRGVIERDELVLHYQPLVDLREKRILGVEALLRWRHPDQGLIGPTTFIPIAEDSGLIIPIGAWALRAACAQNQNWCQAGHSIFVSINISALQFRQSDFLAVVAQVLRDTGLTPSRLKLELTESVLMHDTSNVKAKFEQLRALGAGLAIDDFGTGYSSLSYLHRLPIDVLKIDRSFVGGIGADPQETAASVALIRAVTTLGHSLKMSIVAEGIETYQQLELLRKIGCDIGQGDLFSPPIPANQIESLFHQPLLTQRFGPLKPNKPHVRARSAR